MPSNRVNPVNIGELSSGSLVPAAVEVLRAFRRAKPWRGTFAERWDKFMGLRQGLSEVYGVAPILEFRGDEQADGPGNGAWRPEANTIILTGKLSVVTFLYCFAGARGMSRESALTWSRNVFRRFFPTSAARCRDEGGMLIRGE